MKMKLLFYIVFFLIKIQFYFRYANDERSFSFYINEDSFIISTLNELIKALQTEKHTQVIGIFIN